MIVTILGSGTSLGVPVIACECNVCTSSDARDHRLRSSILIQDQGLNIVVDSGPDFRQQMLNNKVNNIDAILFTHQHRDHTAGLDDIRAFNYMLDKKIPVFARQEVIDEIKKQFDYVFTNTEYAGVPQLTINSIGNAPFNIGPVQIEPVLVKHHLLDVFGYRIGKFCYITDASSIPSEELPKLENLDVLIVNALRIKPHFSHFSLPEALDLIKKLRPKKAYITHMSHFIGKHSEVNKELPENVELAWDGLKINI